MIGESFNYLNSKKAVSLDLYRKHTKEPRSFLCINFTGNDGIYYESIKTEIKLKNFSITCGGILYLCKCLFTPYR